MAYRKLAAFVPLAALVGAVVHLAAAGLDHAPGRGGFVAFALTLAAPLTFALGRAFRSGFTDGFGIRIATRPQRAYGAFGLALAGLAVYALIECLEGHLALGGLLRACAAALPVAALARIVCRSAARAATYAGACCSAWLRDRAESGSMSSQRLRRRTFVFSQIAGVRQRGRAPPLFR